MIKVYDDEHFRLAIVSYVWLRLAESAGQLEGTCRVEKLTRSWDQFEDKLSGDVVFSAGFAEQSNFPARQQRRNVKQKR